jgi:hypothetical protein
VFDVVFMIDAADQTEAQARAEALACEVAPCVGLTGVDPEWIRVERYEPPKLEGAA